MEYVPPHSAHDATDLHRFVAMDAVLRLGLSQVKAAKHLGWCSPSVIRKWLKDGPTAAAQRAWAVGVDVGTVLAWVEEHHGPLPEGEPVAPMRRATPAPRPAPPPKASPGAKPAPRAKLAARQPPPPQPEPDSGPVLLVDPARARSYIAAKAKAMGVKADADRVLDVLRAQVESGATYEAAFAAVGLSAEEMSAWQQDRTLGARTLFRVLDAARAEFAAVVRQAVMSSRNVTGMVKILSAVDGSYGQSKQGGAVGDQAAAMLDPPHKNTPASELVGPVVALLCRFVESESAREIVQQAARAAERYLGGDAKKVA